MRIDTNGGTKLDFFKALYEDAVTRLGEERELMRRRLAQYNGAPDIDGGEKATLVRNITYELIESQISNYIPTPSVTPEVEADDTERNAKAVETLLRGIRNKMPYERINDLDERYSTIYGASIWLAEWDESLSTATTRGDVKLTCVSPNDFVPQPDVYDIADMEYAFISAEVTLEELTRRYDVTDLDGTESEVQGDDTATLKVCYYRDEDDRVCQYAWSGDVELLDLNDYYARRRKVCKVCGEREGVCACEKPKYKDEPAEEEVLTEDVKTSDGVILAMSPVYENGVLKTKTVKRNAVDPESGEMLLDTAGGLALPLMMDVAEPVVEQTRIPYYRPKTLPIVIRKNTSQERHLYGVSDCDVIRPQQQAINKIETRIQEKLLRAGVFAMVPEGHKFDLTNDVFRNVVETAPENVGLFGRIDLQVDVSQDRLQAERLYDHAKRILGISDSFQGQYDSSAQSGVAKQMQIQQAAGRLESKRRMKNAAYADVDRIIFELYLAYADEPRPVAYRDANGRRQNIAFNRYDFVRRNEQGEWYYDDRYLFSADASVDVEGNRAILWEQNTNNFRAGAYGDPTAIDTILVFWRNMERAHYPNARDNVERFEAIQQQQQMMAEMQAQLASANQEIAQRREYEDYLLGGMNNGTNV